MDDTQSLVFGLAYVIVIVLMALSIPLSFISACISKVRANTWEHGVCKGYKARRNPYTGVVEFQTDMVPDTWLRFGAGHDVHFKPQARRHG